MRDSNLYFRPLSAHLFQKCKLCTAKSILLANQYFVELRVCSFVSEKKNNFSTKKWHPAWHLSKNETLQIVLTNEGNVDAYDVVILILVTDEYGETIHEQQSKIDSIGPQESRIFYSDAINIEAGVLHEWFIKLEEVEKEENLNDNLFSIFGFIPPEG